MQGRLWNLDMLRVLGRKPTAAAPTGCSTRCHMLGRERPEAVLPVRALYLPTFSHFLIVNKTSLSRARGEWGILFAWPVSPAAAIRVSFLLTDQHSFVVCQ
jgi:hypothetical protein